MRIFNKKDKKSNSDNDFFTLLEEPSADNNNNRAKPKTVPRHVLTPDEVLSGFKEEKPADVKSTGALDSLKNRIILSGEKNNSVDFNETEEEPQGFTIDSFKTAKQKEETPVIEDKTEDVALPEPIVTPENEDISQDNTESESQTAPKNNTSTLLDKCVNYIKDEEGKEADLNAEPLYKLQSVAEILQSESDENLRRLSAKYDISFDDLGRVPKKTDEEITPKPETKASEPKHIELKIEEPEISENEAPRNDNTEFETRWDDLTVKNENKISFINVQSNVKSVISDIDMPFVPTDANKPKDIHDTATITFTPVNDNSNGFTQLKVSSKTRPIDLTGEISELPETYSEPQDVQLEQDEFEDYIPQEELDCKENAGKFLKKFSINRRNYFLISTVSIFLTFVLAISKLPFMSQLILSSTRTTMIVFSVIAALIVIVNGDMFLSLKNIFKRKGSPDICAALASVTTLAYAVFGIISETIISDVLLLLGIILSFRSLTAFFKSSYMLSNLKLVGSNSQKKAIKLIDDNAVTFAMSKNAIEGDVLIAAPQKTTTISNFMKYSTFGVFLGGKLPVLTAISLLLSLILGFTCTFYFGGAVYGLYAAAAVQCFTAFPVAFLIDALPLYRACKKLKRKGGMIAGKTAAEHLEMANAVVIEAADLFPKGKITLHQMKVLSENNLEDTLIRAASLTENLGSSLAPIFKEIAGTGNIEVLPDSDTVKYEDRMGISGWVDNRLLFIGNRTLMEAHSIEVPPVEVDRKILRKGFFPVYVATREKACALLIIQYHVDNEIARELRELTASGVTLLVNSCDPNLIEEMICDYFGLYSDSVKVMSAAGSHMYKNVMSPTKSAAAPALYRNNPLALVSILNCAAKIKKSNILLSVMYIIFTILGAVIFAYSSLGGSGSLIAESTLLIYGLLSTVISYIVYFFARP